MTERLGPRRGNGGVLYFLLKASFLIMSQAMQTIVDGYVKLSGRKALQDLKQHRERLATELRSLNSVLDLNSTIGSLETEIAIIDDGLARLNTGQVVSIAARGASTPPPLPPS
jgi:hypothetical protein